MRILITGGAGFLGSHLSDHLLADGHEVIGMDNFITGSPDNIAHLANNEKFSFYKRDVSNYIFVAGICCTYLQTGFSTGFFFDCFIIFATD